LKTATSELELAQNNYEKTQSHLREFTSISGDLVNETDHLDSNKPDLQAEIDKMSKELSELNSNLSQKHQDRKTTQAEWKETHDKMIKMKQDNLT